MASGARPQGEKAAAEKAARATARGERASRSEGDFKSRPRRFEDGDQRRDEGREDRSRRFEGRSEGRPASRPPRGEGDFQSRPRRFNDGDQRREEGRDDRPRRFEGRSEGRPEGRYEPRAPRPEGRDDRKQERRPGKRERAELKSGGGERSSGGYEGRSFGKPSGPRSSGPRSGGAEGRGPSKGGGGFGKGPDRGGSGGKPSNGRSGDGKPRGGKPGVAVRIVGGKFRGRALVTPSTNSIRPTTDRTRESLFNILAHSFPDKVEGGRVLDLFAGTGALGLEALAALAMPFLSKNRRKGAAFFVRTSKLLVCRAKPRFYAAMPASLAKQVRWNRSI